MRHWNLEYYPAHEYERLNNDFYNYKQQSIAELSQYKAAFEAAQKKRVVWNESHSYAFLPTEFYILYNSHTDEIFYSVGAPCFNCTHYIIGNNIPKP